ncbi:MAG: methyltransferase domain-containing protein [Opitutaceae bacterium]|nr:methyltransferase domain-containing protein [Opitutaceae bacterium]
MSTENPQRAAHDDWDTHWDRYAAAASLNPAQQMRHDAVVAEIRARRGSGPLRIVDLGSGQGDLLVKLRAAFPEAELLGLELSHSGVEISRAKVPDATLLVADLFSPPAELQRFAGWATHAVCSEVLEHVDSPEAFLRAASVCLGDDCAVVVTVPSGPMSAFDRHIGHRQHFTRDSIAAVFHAAGYAVERVRMAGFPFFNLYRLTVIARGKRLTADIEQRADRGPGGLAAAAMAVYRFLFRFNTADSRFGWQVIAIGRKPRVQSGPGQA